MDVALFHNYRERAQKSMMLYADRLGQALERRSIDVTRVQVEDFVPAWASAWPLTQKLDSYAGRFLLLPRVARRQRASINHIIDHGQGFLVRHLDPARTVVTCHDLILLVLASGRMGSAFAPPLATRILRMSVNEMLAARQIVTDSESTRRDLLALTPASPERVQVIYPGLNYRYAPDRIRGLRTRTRFGLGEGALILQVGQTGFYKNLPGCLRVIAKLRSGGIPVTFVRGGHRLRAEHLVLAERLGIADSIRDLGPLDDDSLAGIYNAADVLLFPSLYEGFGWPPIEAMASGLPVVCSRAGSLGEIIGKAALTAEPEDVDGLANHVAAVLGDISLANSLRTLGLEHARLFDWDRAAAAFEEVYQRILES